VLLTRIALLVVLFDLTKKARAISCSAPPPFSKLAPDSPDGLQPRLAAASIPKAPHHQTPLRSLLFSICTSRNINSATNTQLQSWPLLQRLSLNVLPAAYQRSK
jgi:hypothetical protein